MSTTIFAACIADDRTLFTNRDDAQWYIDTLTDYGHVEEWHLHDGTGEPARLGVLSTNASFGPPGSPGTNPELREFWETVFPDVDGPPRAPVVKADSGWTSDGLGFHVFVQGYDPVALRAAFDEAVAVKAAEVKARFDR